MSENEAPAQQEPTQPQADQPTPPQAEEIQIPTLEITDEEAQKLVMPMAVALSRMRLFEGAMINDRLATTQRVAGPLAVMVAGELVALMRGHEPKLGNVKRTIRDLFRGFPFPPQMQQAICALQPNSKPFRDQLDISDDDGTLAAKVRFEVEMVPTIIIAGASGNVRPIKK